MNWVYYRLVQLEKWLAARKRQQRIDDSQWVNTGQSRPQKKEMCHGYYRTWIEYEELAIDICDERVTRWKIQNGSLGYYDQDGHVVITKMSNNANYYGF